MKSITIDNFRSHEHLEIPLGGVTILQGSNMSGKSNAIRAAKWLFHNAGGRLAKLARYGTTEAKVSATLDDSTVVTRQRTEGENQYVIQTPDGRSRVLSKIGAGPVEDVRLLTGVMPVEVGSATYDFHFQGVGNPSVLDISPSDFHNLLSRITGAELVDVGARAGATAVREAKRRLATAEQQLSSAEATVSALRGAERLPELLRALKGAEETHKALTDRLWRLQDALRVLSAPTIDMAAVERAEQAAEDCEQTEAEWHRLADRRWALQQILAELQKPTVDVERVSAALTAADQYEDEISRLTALQQRHVRLQSVLVEIRSLDEQIAAGCRGTVTVERELEEAIVALGECPLCGQSTKEGLCQHE